jgi:hypothetical protein
MASRNAENARRIRPSNFIVIVKLRARLLPSNREKDKENLDQIAGHSIDSARILLFRNDNVAALDGTRQVGPLNRDVAEVDRNAGTHQWVGFIANMEVQVWLGRIAG